MNSDVGTVQHSEGSEQNKRLEVPCVEYYSCVGSAR